MIAKRSTIAMAALLFGGVTSHAQDFPEGPGKEIVVATCGGCHDINRIKVGYTPDGWRTVERMMRNMEVPISDAQWPLVTSYLTTKLPERPRPPAVIVAGPVAATVKVWPVPTAGSRPHDPLATKDGMLWWTGQLSNRLGRLDPKSGAMQEFVLKSPHTGPHGLAEDRAGNIWFTANNLGFIGKLDPKSGEVSEYKLPAPGAKDPHTLIFDRDGILWFTAQQANLIGRLDPKSGDIKLIPMPSANSRPYGMALNSKNEVFVVLFGTNKVARIGGATAEIKEYSLPAAEARPRRIAISPDDMVWYSDFRRGFLGRLDPATGEVKEWPSPSGPKSEPYAVVFTRNALWYSETAAKPNTIVRFDPKTEQFQSWAVPGGGDIIRNMDVAPDGSPVLAHSLTNEVGLVEIK
jgi:virginiamycin B lyase